MEPRPNPLHRKETEWHGERYFFEGVPLSPDDPEFKRRQSRGPNAPQSPKSKKRVGKKKK